MVAGSPTHETTSTLDIRRTQRWLRAVSLLLVAFVCTMCMRGAYAQTDALDPGVTFEYKIGWVDVETSTFGVSLLPKKKDNYVDRGNVWGLMLRYDPNAMANITQMSSGWGLTYYDYTSWILGASSTPFKTMYFIVHSSGQMSLENTVLQLTTPEQLYFVPNNTSSGNLQELTVIPLTKGVDYTINNEVNLSENPKSATGPWIGLEDTQAEAKLSTVTNPSDQTSPTQTSADKEVNVIKTADAPAAAATDLTSPSDSTEASTTTSDPTKATVLPPVKFIKGDPNYDPDVDVLGTVLAAPKTGLYLTSAIIGIGLIAHAAGSYKRFQYQREYRLSVQRTKSSHFRA
ncbi:hypothetical protein LPJ53_001936 [Coemansia erecta]|uniref:Uncharacterized protein n=1 Tax=Coemansia erecta TaxID=147472 RepID=A0A9W7Y3X6_9FUNG|nr:hypothetical protein LPJ53_001936 [Coemansia erecta]